jgi:RNA recognition motif-containing protein
MNIYVGNLSWQTTEPELQELFEGYGQVSSVAIIKDKYTGKSRGFAFVEMPDDGEARAAIDALNETEFGGRSLKVNEARPKEPRSQGGRGERRSDRRRRGGGGGDRDDRW